MRRPQNAGPLPDVRGAQRRERTAEVTIERSPWPFFDPELPSSRASSCEPSQSTSRQDGGRPQSRAAHCAAKLARRQELTRLRSAKLELQMVTAGNLLRATSGNGSSLACIVIGVSYLRVTRGMCRTPTAEKPAYMPTASAKLLPNRRSFCTEISLWRILLDAERRSLPPSSLASQRLRTPSPLNIPSPLSCQIPIALSKAGRPCPRA